MATPPRRQPEDLRSQQRAMEEWLGGRITDADYRALTGEQAPQPGGEWFRPSMYDRVTQGLQNALIEAFVPVPPEVRNERKPRPMGSAYEHSQAPAQYSTVSGGAGDLVRKRNLGESGVDVYRDERMVRMPTQTAPLPPKMDYELPESGGSGQGGGDIDKIKLAEKFALEDMQDKVLAGLNDPSHQYFEMAQYNAATPDKTGADIFAAKKARAAAKEQEFAPLPDPETMTEEEYAEWNKLVDMYMNAPDDAFGKRLNLSTDRDTRREAYLSKGGR